MDRCNGRKTGYGHLPKIGVGEWGGEGYCKQPLGWGTDHPGEGRCKHHGGSGGAPKRNKNAVRTGEHETIWLDQLDDEERALFDRVPVDVLANLNEKIRLSEIRIRRMMARIRRLKQHEFTIVNRKTKKGKGPHGPVDYDEKKLRATLGQIQDIEEALTRVLSRHEKLLKLKHQIQQALPPDDEMDMQGYIDALNEAAQKIGWPDESE